MARRVPAGSSLEEGTKDLLLPTQTMTWLRLPRRDTTEKTKPLTLAYLRNWRISSSLRMVGIVGRKRPKRKGRNRTEAETRRCCVRPTSIVAYVAAATLVAWWQPEPLLGVS